ncbi:hypothetical protein Ancab_006897 [Ancistrocladus abbreviatus]
MHLYLQRRKHSFSSFSTSSAQNSLENHTERERESEASIIAMAGLQRSSISFRRQGSSGLVWDDKSLCFEDSNITDQPESGGCSVSRTEKSSPTAELRRSKSDRGCHATSNHHRQRTVKVPQAEDPPSPKLSGCCFYGAFSKSVPSAKGRHRKAAGGCRAL